MAGFVIEMTDKRTGERCYVCSVPVMGDDCEYENTPVNTLDEARLYPYADAEVAAAVVSTFPEAKNLTYRVLEIVEKSASAGMLN